MFCSRPFAVALAGTLLLAALPIGLAAQIEEGQLVRVRQGPWIPAPYRDVDRPYIEGRFVSLSDDVLLLRLGETRQIRVQVSNGVTVELGEEVGDYGMEGFRWGTLGGLAVGAGLVLIRDGGDFGTTRALTRVGFGVVTGWTVGALYGSSIPKVEWTPVRTAPEGRVRPLLERDPSGRLSVGLRVGVP